MISVITFWRAKQINISVIFLSFLLDTAEVAVDIEQYLQLENGIDTQTSTKVRISANFNNGKPLRGRVRQILHFLVLKHSPLNIVPDIQPVDDL